jgi:hypothetical protein
MITSTLTKRICIAACFFSLVLPGISSATSSTDIQVAHIQPAQHDVKLTNCFTTKEQRYNVTMVDTKSAYPDCPPDMVIDKVNLRTEGVVTIDTYVSLVCCKQDVGWKKPA